MEATLRAEPGLRVAVTADLHWGHQRGDDATRLLVDYLYAHPPDLLLLGGDLGTADHFGPCLDLFRGLTCPKLVTPGNHDLWVADADPRGDSLDVYTHHLPALCQTHGCHYLDQGPFLWPQANLGVVGSINWYDYSWALERMRQEIPDWEWRLRHKAFTRGRHNDGRFIRWPLDDVRFTAQVVAELHQHLSLTLAQVDRVLVLTHHPACYGLNFPRERPPDNLDGLLWDALSGNASLEKVLREYQQGIAYIFSGHTHRARTNHLESIPSFNIGGDYHFKRLLLVPWPAGPVEHHVFGDP